MRLHGETAVLIDFGERPDLSPALTMDWEARGQFVVNELRSTARAHTGAGAGLPPLRGPGLSVVLDRQPHFGAVGLAAGPR